MLDPDQIVIAGLLADRWSPAVSRMRPVDAARSREVRVASLRSLRSLDAHRARIKDKILLAGLLVDRVRLRSCAEVMLVCPCCRRVLPGFEELIAARVEELRHACEQNQISIDDGYVDERAAAQLLGYNNHRSLANRRFLDAPIAFRKVGRSILYRIEDLAAHTLGDEAHASTL